MSQDNKLLFDKLLKIIMKIQLVIKVMKYM
jgi:hypothetical protein